LFLGGGGDGVEWVGRKVLREGKGDMEGSGGSPLARYHLCLASCFVSCPPSLQSPTMGYSLY